MIIVLGATGNNGRQVVKALRAENAAVRAVVRDVNKAAELSEMGAEVVSADLAKPETLAAVFAGGTSLFLLTPVAVNQVDLELNALAAARSAGIGHVVKLSAIGADPLAAGHFSRVHGIGESALKSSGLGWTIVRGSFFYTNLLFAAETIKRQNLYAGHWAGHHAAWIDPQDLSAVAAKCLLEPRYAGQTLIATGPAAITNVELSGIFTGVLGRPIEYVDQPPEQYAQLMISHGVPEWLVKAEIALRDIVVSGEAREITGVVERVTGQRPKPIADWIDRHRGAFSG